MANTNKNIIKEIAENIDCGYNCYYNSKTNEIITIPNFLNISDEEDFKEFIQEDLEKINKQKADFVKFEVLESSELFKIMERFVEQIPDQKFKSELENILYKKKPFQNFKYLINNSDYRQKWFNFKQIELERIVENQLNR